MYTATCIFINSNPYVNFNRNPKHNPTFSSEEMWRLSQIESTCVKVRKKP